MQFDVDKCQVLQVETKNKCDYEMCGITLKNIQYAKDQGVKIE